MDERITGGTVEPAFAGAAHAASPAAPSLPGFVPVTKRSVSQSVFEQLRDGIVHGRLEAGEALPAERELSVALGVNRSAVREALKRLEQAGLVDVRQGGASRVLDYRTSGGLDLLPELMLTAAGGFDTATIRSVLEMRSAIGPDVARLAVERRADEVAERIEPIVAAMADAMADAGGDLPRLQDLSAELWAVLIECSENVAYRLAYNSLRQTYDRCRELLADALSDELRNLNGYRSLLAAARDAKPEAAEAEAKKLVRLGERGVGRVLAAIDASVSASAGRRS